MQEQCDIFSLWDSETVLAEAISQKPDTVYRWKKRHRIPEAHWNSVIDAARKLGKEITASDLHRFNAPMKMRGRPSHKRRKFRVVSSR